MSVISITVLIRKAANYLEIPGLLDLACKEYARRIKNKIITFDTLIQLTQELVDLVLEQYLHYFRDHSIAAVYLIHGGIARDRHERARELSGAFYMFDTFNDTCETGICLFANFGKYEALHMDMNL